RCGKQINALFLVQGPNHDLKLRVGKDAAQRKNSRCNRTGPEHWKKQRIDCIRGNCRPATTIASSYRKLTHRSATRGNERKVWGVGRNTWTSGLSGRATSAENALVADVELT